MERIRNNIDDYQRKYGTAYIAFDVSSMRVIYHDKNQFNLERKIRRDFPSADIFITDINSVVNPKIVEMESPERM